MFEGLGNLLSFDNLNGPVQFGYDIFNTERNYRNQRKLYDLQVDQYEYQKRLQQEIFNREDNAVQRRAADLKAAGFNPLLAAGGAASTGQAVSTSTPSSSPQHAGLDLLARTKAAQDISMTKAQQELVNSQASLTSSQADISKKTAELLERQLQWYRDHPNVAPGVPGMGSTNALDSGLSYIGNLLTNPDSTIAGRIGGRVGALLGNFAGKLKAQKSHVTSESKRKYLEQFK